MFRLLVCSASLLLAVTAAVADDAAKVDAGASKETDAKVEKAETQEDAKTLSGMSVLGNQEAPKSLVIVPWKSSQIGDMPDFSRLLDDSTKPVDKEVFMRELAYYQVRSDSK